MRRLAELMRARATYRLAVMPSVRAREVAAEPCRLVHREHSMEESGPEAQCIVLSLPVRGPGTAIPLALQWRNYGPKRVT